MQILKYAVRLEVNGEPVTKLVDTTVGRIIFNRTDSTGSWVM